jgi:lauroyl/myristoyl acyltransferase/mitochondrial fission protein ELM1
MKTDSLIDYLGFITIKLLGPLARALPRGLIYSLGSFIGELFYCFDPKHKSLAYANIKTALGSKMSPTQLSRTTKDFYRNFGQNIIELFCIPMMNSDYINKYISIEGFENAYQAIKKGKGLIILGVHAGGWELVHVISANLGVPMVMLVRDQRYPRLNKLLNAYRSSRGGEFIRKGKRLDSNKARPSFAGKELIEALRQNQVISMTADQGGRQGCQIKFFGKDASMSSGAIRMALKHDAVIIPTVCWRLKGPYLKAKLEPAFEIKKTGDFEQDVRDNLTRLTNKFEQFILEHPKEYLWSYKIYKYSREKNILILNDGKTGHLRQSQGLAKIICSYLGSKGIKANVNTADVIFKNSFSRYAAILSATLAGRYHCQGCSWCLKNFLKANSYRALADFKPDIVVSCGSASAGVNFVVSRENAAKSAVILRPSVLGTKRFDLVVMPEHDGPPRQKNIAVTVGSLNTVDEQYLKSCAEELKPKIKLDQGPVIGFLVGGDTKDFRLDAGLMVRVIKQIKELVEKVNGQLLITTSRRTSKEVEELLKVNFAKDKHCKLLIIANEDNPGYAFGGILALSHLVVVSGESISMVSEAAGSGRYVVVFKSRVGKRHEFFLKEASKKGYIYLSQIDNISQTAKDILREKPKIMTLNDRIINEKLLSRIL